MSKKTINQQVKKYLQLKANEKANKTEMAKLKEEIDEYADEHIADFVDKELVLETGVLKIALSNAKAIYSATGKPLSTTERKELAELLPEDATSTQIDLAKASNLRSSNQKLDRVLKAKGVEIVRDSRYDVKAK